jgi:hypothetical protein
MECLPVIIGGGEQMMLQLKSGVFKATTLLNYLNLFNKLTTKICKLQKLYVLVINQ